MTFPNLLLHGSLDGLAGLGQLLMLMMLIGGASLLLSILHIASSLKNNKVHSALRVTSFIGSIPIACIGLFSIFVIGDMSEFLVIGLLLLVPFLLDMCAVAMSYKKANKEAV